jgi:hypothetical protein
MKTFFIKLKWKFRGKETLKLPNGDLYIGDIDHLTYIPKSWGTLTGKGVYIWANSDIYEGNFVEGVPHGNGTFRYANGNVYKGFFRDGKCHGIGTLKYPDHSIYKSEWYDGKMSEEGTLMMSNGDVFEGKWKEGCKKFKGIYKFYNGDSLDGEFKTGDYHGKGTYYTKDGKFSGIFVSSRIETSGLAKLELNEGEYEGEIEIITRTNREFKKLFGYDPCDILIVHINGKGVFRYNNGYEYRGSFINGKFHGKGIMKFGDDSYYEGDWENGIKNGDGEMKYADGVIYKGGWEEDKWNGIGTLYFTDGTSGSAEFENNKIIRHISTDPEPGETESDKDAREKFISIKSSLKFPGLEFSEN